MATHNECLESYNVSATGCFNSAEIFDDEEVRRCGSLGAVLGYHSVFSPFIIEAIRSDALT